MDRTPRSVTLLGMLLAAPCSTAGELSPPCPPVSQAVTAGFDPQPYLDDLQEARAAFSAKYAGLEPRQRAGLQGVQLRGSGLHNGHAGCAIGRAHTRLYACQIPG